MTAIEMTRPQEVTFKAYLSNGPCVSFMVQYDEPLDDTEALVAARQLFDLAGPVYDTEGLAWTFRSEDVVALCVYRVRIYGADHKLRDNRGRVVGTWA